MGTIFGQERLGNLAIALAGVFLAILTALVLLVGKDPLAPLLLIGAAISASVGLFLVERPLLVLCSSLFLLLLPHGLRLEPIYTIATNGMLLIALGAWLLRVILRRTPIRWNGTCLLTAFYIFWAGMSLIWAGDLVESRKEIVAWIIGFILVFLFANQLKTVRAIDRLMMSMALFGWLLVLASFHTILFMKYDFVHRLRILDMNENMLGILMILMLPGIMWFVLRASGLRRAVLMSLSIFYILCTLAFTALSGSRGSALSLVFILFAFLFSKATRPWGTMGVVLVSGLLVAAPFLLDVVLHRFAEEAGGVLGGRDLLWEASIQFIHDHLWTGAGIGNGVFRLHDYIAALTSANNHRFDLPSHQPLLEIGVDTGLPGMVIYAAILLSALWSFAKSRSLWLATPGAPAGYHAIVAGITVGYLASWFKAGGLEKHPTFFLLLVLLLVPSCVARAARSGPGTALSGLRGSSRKSPAWPRQEIWQGALPNLGGRSPEQDRSSIGGSKGTPGA